MFGQLQVCVVLKIQNHAGDAEFVYWQVAWHPEIVNHVTLIV